MKQITKSEFVKRITSGKSLFVGISPTCGETEIDVIRNARLEKHKLHARTCVAKSNNHLVFDGESHLELKDIHPHTFIKCYEDDDILVVENKWLCFDYKGNLEETRTKYLYYRMER